ncbi:MAG: HIT domain-containing protein [Rhodothermales bacterium]|nr:HIT domain-containing protein [Rhodothermales bacterium]
MWSPWRSEHVRTFEARRRPVGEGSVFARIAAEPDRDEEHLVVWRGANVFAVMNLYPYNNGHLLLVPYREVAEYTALTAAERHALADATDRALRWLERALRPDGFNVGMNLGAAGGAGIPEHLHVHVVPRWGGDTNFMPVVGDAKVVPEGLEATYRKLRAAVAAEADA